jgi:hypothetical protein
MSGRDTGMSAVHGASVLIRLVVSFAICLALPNVQQIMRDYDPILEKPTPVEGRLQSMIRWRPSPGWAFLLGALFLVSLIKASDVSKFLYFQF